MSSRQFPSGNTNLVNPFLVHKTHRVIDLGSQTQDPRKRIAVSLDHRLPLWATRFFSVHQRLEKADVFGKLWNQNATETACWWKCLGKYRWSLLDTRCTISLQSISSSKKHSPKQKSTPTKKKKQSLRTVITFLFFTSHPFIQVLSPPTTWQNVERRISFACDIPSVPLMTSLLRSDRDSPNHQEWRPWDPKFGVQLPYLLKRVAFFLGGGGNYRIGGGLWCL